MASHVIGPLLIASQPLEALQRESLEDAEEWTFALIDTSEVTFDLKAERLLTFSLRGDA